MVVAGNAVIVAGGLSSRDEKSTEWAVQALDIRDGEVMWTVGIDSEPVKNGLCVDRDGKVIVVLKNGNVVCVG